VQQFGVTMNTGPSSAFRAPGHPPASFGTESMMDELAVKLGMDPVEFRLLNDPNPCASANTRKGAKNSAGPRNTKARQQPRPVKTGVGVAAGNWGGGGKGSEGRGADQSRRHGRGALRHAGPRHRLAHGRGHRGRRGVRTSAQPDQGENRRHQSPFSGGSGGSSTTASVAPAIWDACQNALAALQQQTGVADARGANWSDACKKTRDQSAHRAGQVAGGLFRLRRGRREFRRGGSRHRNRPRPVKKIVAVHDCGLIVNPLTTTSQINGGIICGIGYALYEERSWTPDRPAPQHEFRFLQDSEHRRLPDIEVILSTCRARRHRHRRTGGHPAAGAIANAVANAIGVRVHSLPITPAKVLAALGKVPNMTSV
jgi:xanthine dehydrogenase YagR molybdenum-binding subunit